MSGKVKVWGNLVTVEWADPIEDPDPEVMAKVSIGNLKCSSIFKPTTHELNPTSHFKIWKAFVQLVIKSSIK